jgi:hypothetical protein
LPAIARKTGTKSRRRPAWLRPSLLWVAFDLLFPTALLYVLLWRGSSLYVALLGSASVSAASALVSYRRGTGNQRFAPHMLAMALAGFAIALVTGSERFLLAKESVLTALVGFWFLGSIWKEHPLTYRFTRPILEGRFGTEGVAWEPIWDREPRFRRIWRVSSAMWAVALLIDAVLRVVLAYTLPVNTVPALQTGMMIATTVLMQVVTNVYYMRAGLWPLIHASRNAHDGTSRKHDQPESGGRVTSRSMARDRLLMRRYRMSPTYVHSRNEH